MGSTRFLLETFWPRKNRSDRIQKRKNDPGFVEMEIDSVDGIDTCDESDKRGRTSAVCFAILFYWGLFELIILTLVLLNTNRKNYGQQVINNLCEERCASYIENGLITRLLLAMYMTLGAAKNSWALCLPWLFIDSFGFFPLTPIVVSAFHKYNKFWLVSMAIKANS